MSAGVSLNVSSMQASFARLSSNKLFEWSAVTVIIASALLIGVKTYPLDPLLGRVIAVLDMAITLFFLAEITVRFLACESRPAFFKSGWNVFDTLIVVVSLIPAEDTELAIIGRLVRIFRVLRMVSIIPELRMLLNSLFKALPQLGYVMLLMFIIFYIYAAIGATFFAEINPTLWGDIAISLLTLFRVMTFEDWTDVMYETMAVYKLSWIYYLSFIFFTAFAFLNMVIGIVVSVMEQEQQKAYAEEHAGDPTLEDLQVQIAEIKSLLLKRN